MSFASARVASATSRVWQVSSMTHPMSNIMLFAILPAICAQRCVMDMPNGEGDLHDPMEAERTRVDDRHRVDAEFGAQSD